MLPGRRGLRSIERMFDTVEMAEQPPWWQYPTQCHHGHVWGPGLVTVGWMPCECPEARAANLGHLWVRCHAEPGCASVWYRPSHSPASQLTGTPYAADPKLICRS